MTRVDAGKDGAWADYALGRSGSGSTAAVARRPHARRAALFGLARALVRAGRGTAAASSLLAERPLLQAASPIEIGSVRRTPSASILIVRSLRALASRRSRRGCCRRWGGRPGARAQSGARPGRSVAARRAAPARDARGPARRGRRRSGAPSPAGSRSRPAGSSARCPGVRRERSPLRGDRPALRPPTSPKCSAHAGRSEDEGRWQPCRIAVQSRFGRRPCLS